MEASNLMEKTISRAPGMIHRVGVVGSNPADPTISRTSAARAKIFKTLWALKKDGYSEGTLKSKGERLRYLARHVDLDDPEARA